MLAKGGVNTADKVWQPIGRTKKYPFIHYYYDIEVNVDEAKGIAISFNWEKQETRQQTWETQYGICVPASK